MRVFWLLPWVIGISSCIDVEKDNKPVTTPLSLDEITKPVLSEVEMEKKSSLKNDRLLAFGSEQDFKSYLAELKEAQSKEYSRDVDTSLNAAESPSPSSASQPASESAEGITNNQENGVDEGGIVKVAGDYLVVLRRGRLFSINSKKDGQDSLELVSVVDAFAPEHSKQTWYDELLIYDKKIVVIGYSYGYDATEIGQFVIGEDGSLDRQETHFLRSNDYFSSRNYASRLIDNKLVFYMPFYFFDRFSYNESVTLPGQAQMLPNGKLSEWTDIVDVSNIIRPIEETTNPVLHTIARCDLSTSKFKCDAISVIGPYSRTFYVSANAVYLWTSGKTGSSVYRLPLDGGLASAVLAQGVPTDQFSFKESDDGYLHVLLRESGFGDAMWAPKMRSGAVALLSLSLDGFLEQPVKAKENSYVFLPKVNGYQMHNRFVGSTVLYGSQNVWDRQKSDRGSIHLYDVKTRISSTLPLDHDVQRIESMGRNAVVIGSREEDLIFTSIDLARGGKIAESYTLEQSEQSEQRSHGFFYQQLDENTGLLGLPTRHESSRVGDLTDASAAVSYLLVDDNHLSPIGELTSTMSGHVDDHCQASCVDWYGNARPIFFKNRIFALLGYDLVEGQLLDNEISELRRLNYTPVMEGDLPLTP